jgi:hypothetical protein
MARRNNVQDFLRDVAAQTGVVAGHVWAAVLNADGFSYSIQLNGVAVYKKVVYGGSAPATGAVTDSNPAGDRVTIFSNDDPAAVSFADAGVFIANLR